MSISQILERALPLSPEILDGIASGTLQIFGDLRRYFWRRRRRSAAGLSLSARDKRFAYPFFIGESDELYP